MTPEQFHAAHPDLFFLTVDDKRSLEKYLGKLEVLASEERVSSLAVAGEGNMNRTVRVGIVGGTSGNRSLIAKQSHPWVERYPQISAPWDRVLGEARFYLLASASEEVSSRMPHLVEIDPESRVLVLEDLGDQGDYHSLYQHEQLTSAEAATLGSWLSDLHGIAFPSKARKGLADRGMRELNHEHLFRFPLDIENGLDLDAVTPGLADESRRLASDRAYVARVEALGNEYLQIPGPSDVLLHGDFFPGSWLRTDDGPMMIVPEFAFFGPAEFDVGVLLGHLYLSGQKEQVYKAILDAYSPQADFDWYLAIDFCAVEIMRRLIGVAQLPLSIDLNEKQRLLSLSQALIASDDLRQIEGIEGIAMLQRQIGTSRRDQAGSLRA